MNTLNVMIGVAGSGKSTVANSLKKERNIDVVICPDSIREELCNGNRADQSKNSEVWKLAYKRVEDALIKGENVIFDATMLNPSKRKQIIDIGKRAKARIEAHVVKKDLDIILKQNASRKWKVPTHIVKNMYNSFAVPNKSEGFDAVYFYK